MRVHLRATGTRPLLMHNVQLASPLNTYAKAIKEITGKRAKTDEDRLNIARLEFEGGLYVDDVIGPYLPGMYVFRCLQEGAKFTRDGKKIERGVTVDEYMLPLLYKGPRTVDGLWGTDGDSDFVDMRTVVVSRQKVDRTRPIFREWAVECNLYYDPEVIDFEDLVRIATNAGRMEGLGDYRKFFGRWTAELVDLGDTIADEPAAVEATKRRPRR